MIETDISDHFPVFFAFNACIKKRKPEDKAQYSYKHICGEEQIVIQP